MQVTRNNLEPGDRARQIITGDIVHILVILKGTRAIVADDDGHRRLCTLKELEFVGNDEKTSKKP